MINELKLNETGVCLQVLVSSANKVINSKGSYYITAELKDASGSIPGRKWNLETGDEETFVSGNVIEVVGDVTKYNETIQLTISEARLLKEDEIDVTKLLKSAPIEKSELIKEFNALVATIKDNDCSVILKYFIEKYGDKFFSHPAAHSVHHDYSSGLLMHSLSMAKMADFVANNYNDIDRDLLITGCLLHDMGKIIELKGPVVFNYSIEGKLLGHISIMVSDLRMCAKEKGLTSEVPLLLEHMVLSHHGQYEFGSPVLPLTKEALILSLIDNLDSKIVILDKAYEGVKPGEFTSKVFALDGRMFYKKK